MNDVTECRHTSALVVARDVTYFSLVRLGFGQDRGALTMWPIPDFAVVRCGGILAAVLFLGQFHDCHPCELL
jgi:hypothetical protein